MPKGRTRLTRALIKQISSYVRGGVFELIACEALGVPVELFQTWLAHGQATKARGLERDLFLAVRQARAQARIGAEIKMRSDRPDVWLLRGPGKETAKLPGWSAPPPAAAPDAEGGVTAELLEFIAALLEALKPFPDAHAAVIPLAERFFPHFDFPV